MTGSFEGRIRGAGVRRAAAALLLACAGCGAAPAGDFAVHGMAVQVETDAPFAQQPDLPGRLESTVAAALSYFGGRWSDVAGTTITITSASRVSCGAAGSALGCHDGPSIRLTVHDPGIGELSCVEQTVLVHEIGHAVLGDPRHQDPRWMEMGPLVEALGGRAGYTRHGEGPCPIYPSTWRHLLGSP